MPVRKCGKNKWKIGNGPCMYETKGKARKAYVAYLEKRNESKKS